MSQIKSIEKTAKSIAKLFESIDLYKKADKYIVLTPEFLKLSSGRKKITFSFIKKLSIALDNYGVILLEHEGAYILIHHTAISEESFELFDFYHQYYITTIESRKRCPDIKLSNLIYYDEVLNSLSTMKELTIAEIRRRFMYDYLLSAAIMQQLIIDGHKPTKPMQPEKIKIKQVADELVIRLKFYEQVQNKMCSTIFEGYSISSKQLKILSIRKKLTHHFIEKLQKEMEKRETVLLASKGEFTVMYQKTINQYPYLAGKAKTDFLSIASPK